MFSLHCTYLSIGLKCLSSKDFNFNFFIKNSSKIRKLIQFTPKSSKFGSKMTKFVLKNPLVMTFLFVVTLNMNKIAASGGLVHGASSPFSKVAPFKNLKP
jgi:hypothetical protein